MKNSRGHILIAEDEVALRSLMTHLLQTEGYQVTRVGNGLEALEELATGSFDLLITDANMPLLSGEELIAQAHSDHPDLPVLLVSADRARIRAAAQSRQAASARFAFLPKPFRPIELTRQVARLIDRGSHQAVAVGGS